jgi:hypothetical protein
VDDDDNDDGTSPAATDDGIEMIATNDFCY